MEQHILKDFNVLVKMNNGTSYLTNTSAKTIIKAKRILRNPFIKIIHNATIPKSDINKVCKEVYINVNHVVSIENKNDKLFA